ncbi:hypothetical protein Tco_0587581 [Tanacetum coccineum]
MELEWGGWGRNSGNFSGGMMNLGGDGEAERGWGMGGGGKCGGGGRGRVGVCGGIGMGGKEGKEGEWEVGNADRGRGGKVGAFREGG